jgi:hypothetical protein
MIRVARIGTCIAASVLFPEPTFAGPLKEPLAFFDGATVTESRVQLMFRTTFTSRSIGRGRINSDGSLDLVQQVEEEGRRPFKRRWHITRVAPGRFTGSMSEATGKVVVEEVGNRYRFRFPMKGNLKIEQWLAPRDGGRSAALETIIRKHGIVVGRSRGTIRKIS